MVDGWVHLINPGILRTDLNQTDAKMTTWLDASYPICCHGHIFLSRWFESIPFLYLDILYIPWFIVAVLMTYHPRLITGNLRWHPAMEHHEARERLSESITEAGCLRNEASCGSGPFCLGKIRRKRVIPSWGNHGGLSQGGQNSFSQFFPNRREM